MGPVGDFLEGCYRLPRLMIHKLHSLSRLSRIYGSSRCFFSPQSHLLLVAPDIDMFFDSSLKYTMKMHVWYSISCIFFWLHVPWKSTNSKYIRPGSSEIGFFSRCGVLHPSYLPDLCWPISNGQGAGECGRKWRKEYRSPPEWTEKKNGRPTKTFRWILVG